MTPDTPTGGPTAGDPTATLSASSKAIAVGESVTLLWSTTHALSVTIDQGIGAVGTSGSRQVTPATTTTYTLTATGAEGTTPAEAVVTITVSEPPPTAQLTVSPSTIVQGRESATLTWSTTHALSVSIDNGVGAVTASGSRAVTPTETTTYTLTATGAEGTTPAEARATVTVVEPPPGEPVIKWFEAGGVRGGYILYWSVENAERLVLDPDDSDVTGRTFDLVAEPSVETIYTLTAYGGEGTTPATASVTLAPHPSIESFAASASWSVSGGAVTLSWETSDAVSLSIDNGIGAVTPLASGSMTVRPTETTTYTLTATGAPRSLTTAAAVTIALLPALTGQLAWMEVRNVKTSATKPFIFFQTGYDGAIPTDLLWSDANEVGVLQSGSDALAQGTNPADRIFLIEYGRHGAADNTLEVRHLAASGTNAAFWAASGAGYNKSLYFCRLPGGSDFAGASCIEVPYSTFTAAGHPRTQWDFQSGDSRDAFMESIAGGDTILLVIADSGQTFVSAPAARLSASPATIVRGRSATLSWSTIYAESATIDQGIGAVTPVASGSTTVSPTETTTYTLKAVGAAGTTPATAAVTIIVNEPPTTARLSAAPSRIERRRRSATLSWSTTNAVSVSIDNGVGAVAASGSWAVTPRRTTTYTLTAVGAAGTTPAEASATVRVVKEPPNQPTIRSFTAAKYVLLWLSWNVSDAEELVIDPGDIEASGDSGLELTDIPSEETTYTLTASGARGTTPATASVTVAPDVSIQSFTASPAASVSGGAVTLSWETSDAVSLSIDNGVGAVAPLAAGSVTVRPTATTTYTLTARGAGHSLETDAVTVTVSDPPTAMLTADDTSITRGRSTTLRAASSNALSALIQPGNLSVSLDNSGAGSVSVSPADDTTYTLTVTAANNVTAADSLTVTVSDPPTATLTSDDTSITRGRSTTLRAASSNALSALIQPGNLSVSLDNSGAGSVTVSPTATTTYTLTVTDSNGVTATDSAAVTVTGRVVPLSLTALPAAAGEDVRMLIVCGSPPGLYTSTRGSLEAGSDATAAPGVTIERVRWYTANNNLRINIDPNGGDSAQSYWSGSGAGASKTLYVIGIDGAAEFPASKIQLTHVYYMTYATGESDAATTYMDSLGAGDKILVIIADAGSIDLDNLPESDVSSAPTAMLTADDTSITRGQSTTLRAASSNALSALIQPGNLSVSLDNSGAGSVSVSPTADTTYTLTVTDSNGVTATDSATVTVVTVTGNTQSVFDAPVGAATGVLWRYSGSSLKLTRDDQLDFISGATDNTALPATLLADGAARYLSRVLVRDSSRRIIAYITAQASKAGYDGAHDLSAAWERDMRIGLKVGSAQMVFSLLNSSGSVADSSEPYHLQDSQAPTDHNHALLTGPPNLLANFVAAGAAGAAYQVVLLDGSASSPLDWTDPQDPRTSEDSVSDRPTAMLTADDASITSGQSTALRVTSANARSALIQPGNLSVSLDNSGAGAVTVSPTADTIYTLTVTGPNNVTATDSLTVTVSDPPTAMLTADDTSITRGQSTTLRAASSNALSALIQPGNLSVSLDNSGAGAVTVSPTADTTYTLTVTDSNGVTATDSLTVTVVTGAATGSTQSVFDAPVGAATGVLWRYSGSSLEVKSDGQLDFISGAADNTALPATLLADGAARYLSRVLVRDSSRRIIVYITAQASKAGYDGAHNLTAAWERDMRIGLKVGSTQMVFSLLNSSGSVADSSEPYHLQDSQAPTDHNHALLTGPPNLLANFVAAGSAGAAYQVVLLDGSASSPLDWTDPQDPRAPRTPEASATISTLAGTGTAGYSGDGGAATSAQIREPRSVEVDAAGNVYIADRDNHRIRKVDASGDISTVAGTGAAGFSGDGGAAISAQINEPRGVDVDAAGNIYIADWNNHRIRKVEK